jgi:hypothetical protein
LALAPDDRELVLLAASATPGISDITSTVIAAAQKERDI